MAINTANAAQATALAGHIIPIVFVTNDIFAPYADLGIYPPPLPLPSGPVGG